MPGGAVANLHFGAVVSPDFALRVALRVGLDPDGEPTGARDFFYVYSNSKLERNFSNF